MKNGGFTSIICLCFLDTIKTDQSTSISTYPSSTLKTSDHSPHTTTTASLITSDIRPGAAITTSETTQDFSVIDTTTMSLRTSTKSSPSGEWPP